MTEFTTLLQQGNAWFFIPSAILLGALHGLEPGHSKTMMAAFIIAIKGTIKQAVMLGLAATISHTAVVWLIAFGGMVISKRFTAQSAEPWLQLISAVIIISTAFWMFWRTWRGERNWLENMHEHDHEHHHHDHEDHHDHGHHHHHEHGEYQDAHARAHANDIKRRFDGREVTNWQILLFGLTGGLIPLPGSNYRAVDLHSVESPDTGHNTGRQFQPRPGVNACHRRRWRSNQRSAGRKTLERI